VIMPNDSVGDFADSDLVVRIKFVSSNVLAWQLVGDKKGH